MSILNNEIYELHFVVVVLYVVIGFIRFLFGPLKWISMWYVH